MLTERSFNRQERKVPREERKDLRAPYLTTENIKFKKCPLRPLRNPLRT